METVVFVITAIIAVAAGLGMVLSSNAVHSALFLILNFCAVAVMYLLLRAPFMAAVQIAVYAGAIMVLFLFVIMLLGAEQVDLGNEALGWQKGVGIVLGIVLLIEAIYLGYRGIKVVDAPVEAALDIGSPEQISAVLFSKYLLPFEIISVLLLVAIIGTVVLTRHDRVLLPKETE